MTSKRRTRAKKGQRITNVTKSKGNKTNKQAIAQAEAYRVPSEDYDTREVVRLGCLPGGGDESNPDAIPMRLVVVAMVDQKKDNEITYIAVNTWRLNGEHVGDYASADVIKEINALDGLDADLYFDRAYRRGNMEELLLGYLERENPRPIDDFDSDASEPRTKKRGKKSILAPKKPPFRPTHTLTPFEYEGTTDDAVDGEDDAEIDVVICFINDLTDFRIRLPTNLQASLDHDETYASFREFVLNVSAGRNLDKTLEQVLRDDSFMFWADVEFWVLPQAHAEMFLWTADAGLQAHHFLDPEMSDRYGRQLYIQVRIREAANAHIKNDAWFYSLSISQQKAVRDEENAKQSAPNPQARSGGGSKGVAKVAKKTKGQEQGNGNRKGKAAAVDPSPNIATTNALRVVIRDTAPTTKAAGRAALKTDTSRTRTARNKTGTMGEDRTTNSHPPTTVPAPPAAIPRITQPRRTVIQDDSDNSDAEQDARAQARQDAEDALDDYIIGRMIVKQRAANAARARLEQMLQMPMLPSRRERAAAEAAAAAAAANADTGTEPNARRRPWSDPATAAGGSAVGVASLSDANASARRGGRGGEGELQSGGGTRLAL